MADTQEEQVSGYQTKEETVTQVLSQLKKDLKSSFEFDQPREKDGFFTMNFFIKIHAMIYKYKKYGQEMIAEANSQERYQLLQKIEELKEQSGENVDKIGMKPNPTMSEEAREIQKLQEEYNQVLKGENQDFDKFALSVQDLVFDYFNIIVKEYYLTLDKWCQDQDYVKQIKEEYKKIDTELDEEEKNEPIPEGLDKEKAEQLLSEKEKLLTNVYS